MPGELVTVAAFSTPEEAHAVRILLEAEGIAAHLADENVVGWVWTLDNALGGVKVQVSNEDVEQAQAILAEAADESHRARLDQLAEASGQPDDEGEPPPGEAADEFSAELPGDVLANRAWKAAVFGLVICPLILHVYSAWTLLTLAFSEHEVSASGNRKQIGAFLIDLAVFMIAAYFVLEY
jgi:hypothetical protein